MSKKSSIVKYNPLHTAEGAGGRGRPKVDIFACPYRFQAVTKSYEGGWEFDMKNGSSSKTEWFSGLTYKGPYRDDRKHGPNGELDFKQISLTKNEQNYSTRPIDWHHGHPKVPFRLPARISKNAEMKLITEGRMALFAASFIFMDLMSLRYKKDNDLIYKVLENIPNTVPEVIIVTRKKIPDDQTTDVNTPFIANMKYLDNDTVF